MYEYFQESRSSPGQRESVAGIYRVVAGSAIVQFALHRSLRCKRSPRSEHGRDMKIKLNGYQLGPTPHVAMAPIELSTMPTAPRVIACCFGRLGARADVQYPPTIAA